MSEELIDAAALTARYVLAFVFLTAAVPKLFKPGEFERALRNYALLPAALVRPVGRWLPRLELVGALALLLGLAIPPVAAAAAVLLVAFALAVGINLVRGREIECGCYSSVAPRQIGWGLVAGDVVLVGMALAVALLNPDVLVLDLPRGSGNASLLSSTDGIALVMVAATLVVAQLLGSSLLRLRAASEKLVPDRRGTPA